MENHAVRQQVARIEALLARIEALPDTGARAAALETVQAVIELYGEGLARITALVGELTGARGAEALAGDELISHLLLIHDLHPEDVGTRVARALDEVRPYLRSHGGNVELLRIEDDVAYLRLEGSCSGCPSSTMTLKLAIEEAVARAAPELERIEADGVAAPRPGGGLVQLGGARSNGGTHAPRDEAWTVAGGLPQLAGGGVLVREVAGERVLFLGLDDTFYAYRPHCPACGASLEQGALRGGDLSCGACTQRYDVRRAGRCLDSPQLYLEPIPLLVGESGVIKVALAAGLG